MLLRNVKCASSQENKFLCALSSSLLSSSPVSLLISLQDWICSKFFCGFAKCWHRIFLQRFWWPFFSLFVSSMTSQKNYKWTHFAPKTTYDTRASHLLCMTHNVTECLSHFSLLIRGGPYGLILLSRLASNFPMPRGMIKRPVHWSKNVIMCRSLLMFDLLVKCNYTSWL